MPIIKSAKKRVRQANKAYDRNRNTKDAVKNSIKALRKALSGKGGKADLAAAQSAIDKAVKKGVMHKNKAARKKAQLAAEAKQAGSKVVASAKPAAKKIAAKPAAKKPAAKKPVAKKAPVKKPAAKK